MIRAMLAGVLLSSSALALDWDDCTRDGKFRKTTCYGFEHALITAGVQGAATAIDPELSGPVGAVLCGGFFIREAMSRSGAFGSADDILDWVAPCATAAAIYYTWGERPSWLPYFDRGEAGISYYRVME